MSAVALQEVTRATTMARLLYAAYAWWGFAHASNALYSGPLGWGTSHQDNPTLRLRSRTLKTALISINQRLDHVLFPTYHHQTPWPALRSACLYSAKKER